MNYKTLSIGDYLALQEYAKVDDLLLSKMKMVEVMTKQDVSKLSVKEVIEIYNKETAFMTDPLPTEWQRVIRIKDKEFRPRYSYAEWNAGQFMSFQSLQGEGLSAMPMVMAIMLKEKRDKVLTEAELMERAEWLRENMSIEQAYPLYLFFSTVLILLPKDTQEYSIRKALAGMTFSKLSGVGILCWKALRKGIIPDFRTYYRLMYWHS
jgi:hypothetical protein